MWRKAQDKNWCPVLGHVIVEGICFVLWLGAILTLNSMGKPKQQGFFCDDNSIKYPDGPDTVPGSVLTGVTIAVPAAFMCLLEILAWLCTNPCRRSPRTGGEGCSLGLKSIVTAYMLYFFGYMVVTLMVVVLKLLTGQLRPNFLDVCKPDVDLTTCQGRYITDYNCTNTQEKLVASARKAFPSGHAANGVFMAVFLIMYLERTELIRERQLLKLTVQFLLALYGAGMSFTRVSDHKHHVVDVVCGGLLGLLVAFFVFRGTANICDQQGGQVRPRDVETGNAGNPNDNNNNKNDDDDDNDDDDFNDMDDDNGDNLELPSTPTPLLFNGTAVSSSSGLRIGPLRLEGDKHKFSRRATLQ